MNWITEFKTEILQVVAIIIPFISVMIPKVLGDSRTRRMISKIELGSDLKNKVFNDLITEIKSLKETVVALSESKEFLTEIKTSFIEIVNEVEIIKQVKNDLDEFKEEVTEIMIKLQEFILEISKNKEVKELFNQTIEDIKQMKILINKLTTRLGA